VAGAGPIGLITIAAARAAGAARIFASDKVPERLALARLMGADVVVDARTESLADAVLSETGGRGADAGYEAAGDCESTAELMKATRGGGAVALIGLSTQPEMRFDIDSIMLRELKVVGIRRSNHNTAAALAMLAAGRIPQALVTHRFAIEKTPEAFRQLAAYEGGPGKVVIEAV
jgi:threonine dehydrogenase-like Zn-dependent dehydrogenase